MWIDISGLTSRTKLDHLIYFYSTLNPILWIIFPFNIVGFNSYRLFSILLLIAQSSQSGTKWPFPKTALIRTWRSSLLCEWISLKTWSTPGKHLSQSKVILFWMCIRKSRFFKILKEKLFFSSSQEVKQKDKYKNGISSVIYSALSIFLA